MSLHLHLRDARILVMNLLIVFSCCSAWTTNKRAPFCLLIKSENGSSLVSFLMHSRDASASPSPLFYWSKWTSDGRVEECFKSSDGSLVQNYFSFCHEEERIWDSDEKFGHFNLTAILEDDSMCEVNLIISLYTSQEKQMDSRGKSRQKRAWVLPGTLWCGRGTSANDYEQLGMFEHADRCCREHDHCEHIIRSFSVNFGFFNPSFFTISHCDCDHRFKQCLLSGNDTISNMVGYSFFNVLKLRCFEFIQRRQCTQYNWFGLCTMVKLAPVAVLKDSTPYNSTNLSNENTTFDLSYSEVSIKLKQKTSKPEGMRLTKNQKILDNKFKKRKNLQITGHGKEGRKHVQPNSITTLAPLRKTPKRQKMITQKFTKETILQNTQKTARPGVTRSTSAKTKLKKTTASQSKQMSANTSETRRKRGKSKIQKSSKTPKHNQN